jgi:hypothetical protein
VEREEEMTLHDKRGTQVAFEGLGGDDDPEEDYYDTDSRRNVVADVCMLLFF